MIAAIISITIFFTLVLGLLIHLCNKTCNESRKLLDFTKEMIEKSDKLSKEIDKLNSELFSIKSKLDSTE